MIYTAQIANKVAEYLLEIKAIRLNPTNLFTWASGIQSPIYCDNRISLAYPEVRSFIKNSFAAVVEAKFKNIDVIAGVATAGIAHGALLADTLHLPFCYVRSSAKSHGTQSLIEGKIKKGDSVVVVEDLFSTGGSTIKAIKALQNEGADVQGAVAIFNYGFNKVDNAFAEIGVPFYTLSNFENLLVLLQKSKQYTTQELSFMEQWYKGMS